MTASTPTLAPSGLAPAGRRVDAVPTRAPAGRRADAVPARASGVQLLGEVAGTGYRESPRLVRRTDGQLIKLTPLLYELLEAIDGRRGHPELAAELSRRVGRQATADDVRYLVERKLRPLGTLRQPDGAEPKVKRADPLLRLRPRVAVSKPELTRRLTTPFVWLFSPLVAAPVVLAFAALTAWLLLDKGLSSALHQAFYEPGLILVIWALVVVATAFHEIGHAAACRYEGARPGVIGGGLYLIWPAFYTEVSDSYRLDRRGRLRVDLGGLYFTAIFALATAGLWALTGLDALLLVIAIQLIQMVRQLTPFIRADGYHIVADLVGVPDLFAHVKPTLLGMLPARWRGEARQPSLKPWARAVVTGWIAITVPLLVAVLGMMVLAFPRLAATGWDSIGLRWDEASTYLGAGDIAGLALSAISIVLVALPVLGIVYLLAFLTRRIARRVWRDTAGRPRLRGVALLAGAALAGILAWAWWPGENYRPVKSGESGAVPTIAISPGTFPAVPLFTSGPSTSEVAEQIRFAQAFDSASAPIGSSPAAAAPVPPGSTDEDSDPASPSPPIDRPEALGSAAAGSPQPEAGTPADTPPAWPFPFDPPPPPEPGDNFAMAVNTTDDSSLWDFAAALLLVQTAESVYQANEAHAYASCTNCVTGAVAFQIVLILDQVSEIAPLNAAVAANYDCVACATYAFAYQIVASIDEVSPELMDQLELALQQLEELEANAGSLTALEIYLALEAIEQDILAALGDVLAVDAAALAAAASQGTAGVDGENATSQTDGSAGAGDTNLESDGDQSSETTTSPSLPGSEGTSESTDAVTPTDQPDATSTDGSTDGQTTPTESCTDPATCSDGTQTTTPDTATSEGTTSP